MKLPNAHTANKGPNMKISRDDDETDTDESAAITLEAVGSCENGDADGLLERLKLGVDKGCKLEVGRNVGWLMGSDEGSEVGWVDGSREGRPLGCTVGTIEGPADG